MANFEYTASKSFTPFTFDEMLKPLAMYTQEYNIIQDNISELGAKADIWNNLANQQTDPIAYGRYKSYADELDAQADLLAKSGLNPASRQNLLNLKRRYSSDILPIEQAYAARAEEAKSQYEGRSRGMIYEGDASTSSLDRYLNNPSIRYNQANSQEGFKRVSTVASALAKGLRGYGNGQSLDAYTRTWLQEHGYRGEEIGQAISDIRKILNGDTDVQSNGVLRNILRDEMNTSGVSSWSNQSAINDYFNRVAPALYQAVGQTDVTPYADYGARLQGQLAVAKAKEDAKKGAVGFAPRVIEGAQGEINPNVKRLEGLRLGANGVSTIALDKKGQALSKAQDAMNEFMKGRNKNDYDLFDSYSALMSGRAQSKLGNSMLSSIAKGGATNVKPVGYDEYKKLQEKLNKAQADYDSEVSYIEKMQDKYSHLGNNSYERLLIGSRLEDLQEKEEKTSFPFNAKETVYQNVRKGMANIIGAIPREAFKGGMVGFVDKNGNALDYEDTKKILDKAAIDKLNIKVTGGRDSQLKVVYDGEEYSLKGIEQIDSFNRNLQTVNNYLRDFSNDIVSNVTEIYPNTMREIKQRGIANVSINNIKQEPIPGSSYQGAILHDSSTGEYIKVIIDRNNNIVAANSLSDELTGGENRDSYFINMANRGLQDLMPLFAQDYE